MVKEKKLEENKLNIEGTVIKVGFLDGIYFADVKIQGVKLKEINTHGGDFILGLPNTETITIPITKEQFMESHQKWL